MVLEFYCSIGPILSIHSLIKMSKSFVRSHFDYCDIVYDQSENESLFNKLKSYNATLL